ncbi:MAG TPA: hypothetical protein PK959_06540 [Candidatus Competibacteraceae bacterium]|nr:hypothetical protein [Candidatus Competibacteraceae bacterium]
MNVKNLLIPLALLITPAFGQTIYKCPQADGIMKIQQTPCTVTGGGEAVKLNTPKASGDGLRDSERAYLQSRDEYWNQRAVEDDAEDKRQEALRVERAKAIAAEHQAAAQRATARAIWATGRRHY